MTFNNRGQLGCNIFYAFRLEMDNKGNVQRHGGKVRQILFQDGLLNKERYRLKQLIAKILVSGMALMFTANLIDGIYVDGWGSVFVAAIILGIINAVIRPVLLILTLPLNVFTLGLFTFVINGLMLKTVSTVVAGFDIVGIWPAIIGAVILSVVSTVLNWLISE